MKRSHANALILIVAVVGVLGIVGFMALRSYLEMRNSYDRCVAFFNDAKADFNAVKDRLPTNDLKTLTESRWGEASLRELDEAFDWVAYDERRNVVYFLRPRGSGKIGLNQIGPLREHSGGMHSTASCGFTDQIMFTRVHYQEGTVEFYLHTSARELDRGVLESYGLEGGIQYVLRVDDTDQTFELGSIDHDTFLREAIAQSAPPGKG